MVVVVFVVFVVFVRIYVSVWKKCASWWFEGAEVPRYVDGRRRTLKSRLEGRRRGGKRVRKREEMWMGGMK